MLSVLDALPASALQHIKSLIAHVFSGEQFATTFENIYDQIITPLNLAVFYYSGRYYQLSKRIVGIDYVCICSSRMFQVFQIDAYFNRFINQNTFFRDLRRAITCSLCSSRYKYPFASQSYCCNTSQ